MAADILVLYSVACAQNHVAILGSMHSCSALANDWCVCHHQVCKSILLKYFLTWQELHCLGNTCLRCRCNVDVMGSRDIFQSHWRWMKSPPDTIPVRKKKRMWISLFYLQSVCSRIILVCQVLLVHHIFIFFSFFPLLTGEKSFDISPLP